MPVNAGNDFSSNASKKHNELPQWDFTDWYPDIDSPEFDADFQTLSSLCQEFSDKYKGNVSSLDAASLAAAISEMKAIGALSGKMFTYVQLKKVQDSEKYGQAFESFQSKASPILTTIMFFEHEVMEIPDTTIETLIGQSEDLKAFAPWLEKVRQDIPHTLPLNVEETLSKLRPVSDWVAFYQDVMVDLKFPFDGQELGQGEIMNIITNDPDPDRRAGAQAVFEDVMSQNVKIFARIHNSIMRLNGTVNSDRQFENPWDSRHHSNGIDPAIVDALETSVKDSYERIAHRFYALKARLMGKDHLPVQDRNFNPFETTDGASMSWQDSEELILDAFGGFSPVMAETAQKFFDNGWIDAAPGKNKQGGAFAHPGAAKLLNPMVMTNFRGTPRCVATLAHELGHGIHQYLAAHKGDAIVSTPLTYAETASVFGEMLTFKLLLEKASNDDQKRALLFGKVNDMMNTVFRQIAFYDFEKRNNKMFKETGKPLSVEQFQQNWLESQQESYGDAIPLNDNYGSVFGYIPHFVRTPFYVYAYAFGDALVNALYAVYEEGNVKDFEEKYTRMLEMGGTLKPEDLQDMFGIDIKDPGFWKKGLDVIEAMLDDLENLCDPLLQPEQGVVVAAAPGQSS